MVYLVGIMVVLSVELSGEIDFCARSQVPTDPLVHELNDPQRLSSALMKIIDETLMDNRSFISI